MGDRQELIEDVNRQIAEIPTTAEENVANRPTLEDIAADAGMSRARVQKLYSILYGKGPGAGRFLSLPFDQRVEHGAGHQFKWDRSAQLDSVVELGNKGCFSALVLSMGEAERVQHAIQPDLPLIVKMDGHFRTADKDTVPFNRHANLGDVKRCFDAGADAIGLTFYIGGKDMQQDVERLGKIVSEAHKYHLPVVIWAYSRGPLPGKVGADSLYWCHMGVSAAQSVGADIVKTKFPAPASDVDAYEKMLFGEKGADGFKNGEAGSDGFIEAKMAEGAWAYWQLEQPDEGDSFSHEKHVKRMNVVMKAADTTFVVVSGGPKAGGSAEEKLTKTTKIVMDAGAEGRIIGRNFWGVPIEEGLRLNDVVTDVMSDDKYERNLKGERFNV